MIEAYWEISDDGRVNKDARKSWVVVGASQAKEEERVEGLGRRSHSTSKKAWVLLKVIKDDYNNAGDVREGCRARDGQCEHG